MLYKNKTLASHDVASPEATAGASHSYFPAEAPAMFSRLKSRLNDYFLLTKPTIILLVLFTGATALFIEGSFVREPLKFSLVLLGLYLTGGAASALNQYFERELDAQMPRTQTRRPLPQGKISPAHALAFALVIGVAGVALFGFVFNWLTAMLSLTTILFYSLVYTLLLKPSTPQGVVIGGAAGAIAPVGAWAAATGTMELAPWLLFLIIFIWTPPHFWALALIYKDDYEKTGLPMMPVVKGETSTLNQIIGYTVLLFITSLSLFFTGTGGMLYLFASLALGGWFIKKAFEAKAQRTVEAYRSLFGFSIVYLFTLFIALIVDSFLKPVTATVAHIG